jgi:hypothetical protein
MADYVANVDYAHNGARAGRAKRAKTYAWPMIDN